MVSIDLTAEESEFIAEFLENPYDRGLDLGDTNLYERSEKRKAKAASLAVKFPKNLRSELVTKTEIDAILNRQKKSFAPYAYVPLELPVTSGEVVDLNSGGVLWKDAEVMRGFGMFKGLLFKSARDFVRPLVFDFKALGLLENGIHSLFCPLFDAVFLDEEKRVVDVMVNVKPWQFMIVPRAAFRYLIEVPAGQGVTAGIHLGQSLEFNV